MSADANVNRITLEERIKALESGGSGGGGSSIIPGTAFNPKIIDQCADNAVTDIGSGYVFKLNIENLDNLAIGSGQDRPVGGFGIQSATFFPKIGGAVLMRSFWCAKLTAKGNVGYNHSPQMSYLILPFNASVFINEVLSHLKPTYSMYDVPLVFSESVYFARGTGAPIQPARWAENFGFQLRIWTNTPNQVWIILWTKQATSLGSLNPAVSFGACIEGKEWFMPTNTASYPKYPIGSYNDFSLAGYTGYTAQSLPDRLKPLYPTSWYS